MVASSNWFRTPPFHGGNPGSIPGATTIIYVSMLSIIKDFSNYVHANWMFPFIYNNTWITDDKVLHFTFSIVITYILIKTVNLKKMEAFAVILIIWFVKELFDIISWTWNFETLDMLTNILWFSVVIIAIESVKSVKKVFFVKLQSKITNFLKKSLT